MRLRNYDNEQVEMREYGDSSPVYQNKFKGRKVAIKVVWLYVSQKLDEPYRVSTILGVGCSDHVLRSERVEILQRGRNVETPLPPEYTPTPWRDDAR